jgi:hypothetical protein
VAKLVGVFNTAHSPFTYMTSDQWETVRSNRPPYREDVPIDDEATNAEKAARVQVGFKTLREKLAEVQPDVLLVFGDDQNEIFDFNNHPSIAVYVGETFSGKKPGTTAGFLGGAKPDTPQPQQEVPGHPALATAILTGLLQRGFDPAFMMDNPKPEVGMCHAVMNPLTSLTDFSIPTVALLFNAYYAPQLTANRCYEAGKVIAEIVKEFPEDLRVAAIGSGGLWHTPGRERSFLDEEFDKAGLELLQKGDIKGWADHFDDYVVADDDPSQANSGRGTTGLPTPGGPQGGTRETCNWIGASAMAEGKSAEIVDYIPIYASPVAASFSYWIEG